MFTFSCSAFMKPTSTGLSLRRERERARARRVGRALLGEGRRRRDRSTHPEPRHQDGHAPVTERGDEVQAAVHPVVLDVLPVQATLVTEILLKLLVHIVSDGLPARSGEES